MSKAFFGGSFDPPHAGHLGAARGVLKSCRCDEVVWVPAFSPPHKQGHQQASFADRLAMVRSLLENEPDMRASELEAQIGITPSYTIDILKFFEEREHCHPALLIGADSLLTLHTWRSPEKLVAEYEILTYPRPGYPIEAAKLREHWNAAVTEKLLSGLLDGKFFEISSTQARFSMEKNALRGNIKEETVLPQPVMTYIRVHHLYGSSDSQER